MNPIAKWWSLIFRGLLYFGIPFLAILGERLSPFADKDSWPSLIKWTVSLIVASGAGLVALRAYLDGSAQRIGDDIRRKSSGDTTFITKPPTENQTSKTA